MQMKLIYIVLTLSVLYFLPTSKTVAQQPPANSPHEAQFFTSLQNMPLMPGLVELTGQTIAFDKPEGRIIESVAQIQGVSKGKIQLYYESVLPQFGWSRIAENTFVRGSERLHLSFEDYEEQSFLRVMVMPR